MAKRVETAGASLSNTPDAQKLRGYLEKLDQLDAELDSEKDAYMHRCRAIRDSQKVIFIEAEALGVPKKVLKTHYRLRQMERKKAAIVDSLTADDAELFDLTAEALGDLAALPLGFAALERERSRREREEADRKRDSDALAALQ